jgi:hypothetical protein
MKGKNNNTIAVIPCCMGGHSDMSGSLAALLGVVLYWFSLNWAQAQFG